MNTQQMKLFLTAANCLNFTEAANTLYLSPSSLSRQINAIERELNLQLFLRDNRSVRLTPAGKALRDDLTRVYEDYLASVSRAQGIQRGEQSVLNIGILDGHIVTSQFPELLRQMEQQYPNIRIVPFRGSFGVLTKALYDGTADLVVTLEFSLWGKEQLEKISLSRTKDYLVLLRSHPLAGKDRITQEDLQNETYIGISSEDSPYASRQTEKMQQMLGCRTRSAPNLETCALWTQAGLGMSIVNSHNYMSTDPRLCFIELDDVDCPAMTGVNSDIVLAWHTGNSNPALPVFLEVCQNSMYVSPPPVPSNLRKRSRSE